MAFILNFSFLIVHSNLIIARYGLQIATILGNGVLKIYLTHKQVFCGPSSQAEFFHLRKNELVQKLLCPPSTEVNDASASAESDFYVACAHNDLRPQ